MQDDHFSYKNCYQHGSCDDDNDDGDIDADNDDDDYDDDWP